MSIKQSDSAKIYLSRYYSSSSLCENITPATYDSASPLDNEMLDVYFPLSQVLNRRLDLLAQLSLESDPNRRSMLMNALQQLPSSPNNLNDDQLLQLLKSRQIDSPTELEDYVNRVNQISFADNSESNIENSDISVSSLQSSVESSSEPQSE